MIKVLNTIICYENAEEVIGYVKSLLTLNGSDQLAVAVVINRLTSIPEEELRAELNQINIKTIVVNPGDNLGYMNGMLKGYEEYTRQTSEKVSYVIMSNTDISFPKDDLLQKLIKDEYEPEIWSIGPAVYAPKRKTYDNPICIDRRSKSQVQRLVRIFNTPIINSLYLKASRIKANKVIRERGNSQYVYELHGCFFIIRGKLADKMVKEPFGALLYSEEAYVAEMVWKNRKKSYYDSEILVHHNEHSVTSKINYKKRAKMLGESMGVILRDFYE